MCEEKKEAKIIPAALRTPRTRFLFPKDYGINESFHFVPAFTASRTLFRFLLEKRAAGIEGKAFFFFLFSFKINLLIRKAIEIKSESKNIFLNAARTCGLQVEELKKMNRPGLSYFRVSKPGLSMDDIFRLGVYFSEINK